MNIYIYNCNNTFNYGSMMMGENFISYLDKISKTKNKYFVETNDNVNTKRLREATGLKNIHSADMDSLFKRKLTKYDYIYSYIKIKKMTSNLATEMDLIIVLGGDDFTEDYGWKRPVLNAIKLVLLKRAGLNVVMIGQSMGPYYLYRKPIMKSLLKKLDNIYARDAITYKYLEGLGLKNISFIDDLALLPLTKQEEKERTRKYITYCPSELIYRYTKEGDRSHWIEFNLFMIDKILNKYPDKKLVLLAHVLKPDTVDDRKIVKELYESVKNLYINRIIVEDNEMYPYQVRNYIQQSYCTISSRMHPIVSSIQCEIPAIALSYSNKYWGIIGERFGLEDYIVDVRYMTYDEMKMKFNALLDKVDAEYNNIQIQMRDKNKLAKKSIMNALKKVATLK